MRPEFLFACLVLGAASTSVAAVPGAELSNSQQVVIEGFDQPPAAHAPQIFWFWDQPPDPAYAGEMATALLSKGFSPGYVHPRYSVLHVFDRANNPDPGLPPDAWLGDEWFEAFGVALAKTREAGFTMGYCDEYWWPSLRAQGRVLAAHPELRAQTLVFRTTDLAPGATARIPTDGFALSAPLVSPPASNSPDAASHLAGARWVWREGGGASMVLEATIQAGWASQLAAARLLVHADDRCRVLVNGQEVASGDTWQEAVSADLLPHLDGGQAVVSIEARDDGGAAGILAVLVLRTRDGEVHALPTGDKGWSSQDGEALEDLGPATAGPWNLSPGAAPHSPAVIRSAGIQMVNASPDGAWTAPDGAPHRLYVFTPTPVGGDEVDYLDPQTAEAFIQIAHAPYFERFGDDFGKTLAGVFVDNEGHYGQRMAWSGALESAFLEEHGKDIRMVLPLLLDEDEEGTWPAARAAWFSTVGRQYAMTMGTVSDWLAERGVFTISNFWEEHLAWQLKHCANFFDLQRAYTMPGTDCLQMKVLDPRQFIETRSVCALEGRLMQTELMGALGWAGFTPANIRRGGNAAAAWGVAHVVPHGVFQEGRVGDENPWTPDWGPASPHFDWMDEWTMAVRRNCWMVANSQPDPKVLLLNPMESAWALSGPSLFDPTVSTGLFELEKWVDPRLMEIDAAYDTAIKRLAERHVEALAADTTYLKEAMVEGPLLRLRGFEFGVLVLPPLHTASRDAMRLAAELAEAGGVVVALGELPLASVESGLGDPLLDECVSRLRAAEGFRAGMGALDEIAPSTSLAGDADELVSSARLLDGRRLHWVANQSEVPGQVRLGVAPDAVDWVVMDPWTGDSRRMESMPSAGGGRSLLIELEGLGGRWVLEGGPD